MTTPRLTPLTDDELSSEQRELLAPLGPTGEMNIFRTFVRHTELYKRWSPFAGRLLQRSSFEARDRELIILRSAWHSKAAYEWAHHVPIAREAGLSDEQILAAAGKADAGSADDAALLRAVDELFSDERRIADDTWTGLAARFDDNQLIELVMLAGNYALIAGTLNSLGVQVENGFPAFGEV
jgi:4-carboxymuconolactone decarboxylase